MKKMTLKQLLAMTAAGLTLLASTSAWSATAIIVHPSNTNTLTKDDISRIFLGKKKVFPNGSEAIPIDLPEGSALRSAFVSTVLSKNDQQIKAYWAQLLFTGKGTPPKEISSDAEARKLVAENPALIGYIDKAQTDASVKIVYEF
jgi:ABC-type phosphate transport system substrate-binding protein